MAGLTISDIREALAAQLRANIARDVSVRAYPPVALAPSILIELDPDAVDYWVTFGAAGLSTVRLTLTVDPSGGESESTARRLDDFLSAGTGNDSSIIDAVMTDSSLGLTGVTCMFQSVDVDPSSLTAVMRFDVMVNKVGAAV